METKTLSGFKLSSASHVWKKIIYTLDADGMQLDQFKNQHWSHDIDRSTGDTAMQPTRRLEMTVFSRNNENQLRMRSCDMFQL